MNKLVMKEVVLIREEKRWPKRKSWRKALVSLESRFG